MAMWIRCTGEIEEVHPEVGVEFSLQEIHFFLKGYFEILRMPDGKMMLLDEDGKQKGLPVNQRATVLYLAAGYPSDVIVGNVLIVNPGEIS